MALTLFQALGKRVRFGESATFTGVVEAACTTKYRCVVLVHDTSGRRYNVPLNALTLVEDPKPSLEDDLRTMVVQLEAQAQCCGDGAGGLARAASLATDAAQLRGLLTRHGHDCAPCKVYDNAEDALAALTEAEA